MVQFIGFQIYNPHTRDIVKCIMSFDLAFSNSLYSVSKKYISMSSVSFSSIPHLFLFSIRCLVHALHMFHIF